VALVTKSGTNSSTVTLRTASANNTVANDYFNKLRLGRDCPINPR